MNLAINRLGPGAAEVLGLDCSRPLADDLFAAVRQAFRSCPVLVFRDQTLSAAKLAAFGRRFGPLEDYGAPLPAGAKPQTAALRQIDTRETPDQRLYLSPDDPAVLVMTNEIRADSDPIAVIDNAETWHSDGSHKIEPYKAVILHAMRNPASGGDTEFCDMNALYEALSPEAKRGLLGRYGIHQWSKSRNPRFVLDSSAWEEGERIAAAFPERPQPLVFADPETGRPHLYLSPRFTIRIEGLPSDSSRAILEYLFALMEDPRFVYRHSWRERDLVMWDNRRTNHRVRGYAADDIRCRHRVTVSGSEPLVTFRASA